jgi:hypothetical protein
MTKSAIFVSNDRCDMVTVNIIETIRLQWISWYTNTRDSIELVVVLKTGSVLNTIATQITKQNIYGDVYFVKLYRGKWITIEYSDIPELVDILMTKLTMTDETGTNTPEMQEDCEYYDPESLWDDGWNEGWRTPPSGYDSF